MTLSSPCSLAYYPPNQPRYACCSLLSSLCSEMRPSCLVDTLLLHRVVRSDALYGGLLVCSAIVARVSDKGQAIEP